MTIACLVLASGLSRRFGDEDKLLADLNGQTLLAYCLDTAASVPFDGRFVVTADDGRAELAKARSFNVIQNQNPEDGMGASLTCGVRHILDAEYDEVCVLLGDMPFVTPQYIKKLIKGSARFDVTYSQNEDRLMPPAIFKGQVLQSLTQLSGDKGAQSLDLSRYNIGHVELPDEMARDMDEPHDFEI